jgi:hypothetical protein
MTCLAGFEPHVFHKARDGSTADIWEFQSAESKQAVFCKVFVETNTSGLAYEAGVYEYLHATLPTIPEVYRKNFLSLQCVIRGLSYDELAVVVRTHTGRVTDEALVRNLTRIQCPKPDRRLTLDTPGPLFGRPCVTAKLQKYTVIVTEKCVGRTMWKVMHDCRIPLTHKHHILRTLIRVIKQLHIMGISHNDMHWDNVLIQEDTQEPILFDWDRAQMRAGNEVNPILRDQGMRFMYGTTPYSEARDWLFLFGTLLMTGLYGDRDALFDCFFGVDTPENVETAWWTLAETAKQAYIFADNTNLTTFAQYIQVDVERLVRYYEEPVHDTMCN